MSRTNCLAVYLPDVNLIIFSHLIDLIKEKFFAHRDLLTASADQRLTGEQKLSPY